MSIASERQVDFDGLTIGYDHRVLEPRAWTVAQGRWAAELAGTLPEGPILELCAGAGQIGLLAARESGRRLVCVDSSSPAAEHVLDNARRAGLGERVEIREADLAEALRDDETFPLVIADPPWVISSAVSDYPDDPIVAIDGGADGLAAARSCVEVAAAHLAPQGVIVLQLGSRSQVEGLRSLFDRLGLDVVETRSYDRGVLVRLQSRDATGE